MILQMLPRFSKCVTHIPKCNFRSLQHISDMRQNVGKSVSIKGWVRALRKMKDNIFVDITDGISSEPLQVVISKEIKPQNLGFGSSLIAEGQLVLGQNNKIELQANNVTLIGQCNINDGKYPFAPRKTYPPEYVRQFLHLRPKTRNFSSILRLRSLASSVIDNHFLEKSYIKIHTPIMTSNDCEGAGEIFLVKPHSKELLESMKSENISEDEYFFNCKTYLTVSGQLHLEAAARAFTKVYTFGPTFRAENSKTRIHLSEFYMIEAEVAFIETLEELSEEIEVFIKNIVNKIIEKGAIDMEAINAVRPEWLERKFGYLTYDNAIGILQNHSQRFDKPIKYGEELSKKHELFLVEQNNNTPLFIVNWPKDIKSFYMKECTDDPSKVAALDLLVPYVGELIGGSLREDNYDKLKSKLPSNSNLSWFLELRKYGNVPTGGFGMGFERFLQCLLGIQNIKDTIPFPRWPHNCTL